MLSAGLSLLVLIAIGYRIYLDTKERLAVTTEQNRRNQRAILRLLDEMTNLAEGDLTVHATVTEDITGTIADSFNFAIEELRKLVATVTAFTVAHSLTLAAATLGWVQVAQAPVEAAIALSIVFVAAEVLHARRGHPGLAARMPWVVAFVFGLLHGLGFAGALRDVGLPEHAIPLALAFFNIGVEAGQLLFIAVFFLLVWLSSQLLPARLAGGNRRVTSPTWDTAGKLSLPAAYLIGTLASFWLIERTYGFWV